MQHELRLDVGGVLRKPHAPVVADGVGEQAAVAVEPGGGDGSGGSVGVSSGRRGVRLQPGARDAVPEVVDPVRPRRREDGGRRRVELHVVDGPDLGDPAAASVGLPAVAPECEVCGSNVMKWHIAKREREPTRQEAGLDIY